MAELTGVQKFFTDWRKRHEGALTVNAALRAVEAVQDGAGFIPSESAKDDFLGAYFNLTPGEARRVRLAIDEIILILLNDEDLETAMRSIEVAARCSRLVEAAKLASTRRTGKSKTS